MGKKGKRAKRRKSKPDLNLRESKPSVLARAAGQVKQPERRREAPEVAENALASALLVSPLVLGAIVGSGGLPLNNISAFTAHFVLIASSLLIARQRSDYRRIFAYVGCLAGFAAGSANFESAQIALLQIAAAVGMASRPTDFHVMKLNLITRICLMIIGCVAAAVLGVAGQQEGAIFLETAVIGFLPATLIAAAMVARHSSELQAVEETRVDSAPRKVWIRSVMRPNRRGIETLRPGTLAQLYSLCLLIGGGAVLTLTVFQYLPEPFFIGAIVLLPMPGLAQAFLEHTRDDLRTAELTELLALLASAATLTAGLLGSH
jgi:hypothetical protein